jgi:hypothetical protein
MCGNCERLNLDCEQSDDTTWKIMPAIAQQKSSLQEEPSLLEMFQLRIDGLEQFPEARPPENIPASSHPYTPPASVEANPPSGQISLTSESAFLLQTYVRTVATWMDLFDFQSHYQLRVPQLALKSPLLFHCVCAFSANHLALSNASSNPAWKFVAVKHYGEALRLLIEALSLPAHEHVLTASILLLSYEIHGAQRSEDYRRHFLGLTTLIRSRGITAQCTGTDRANFWIYVRHEIALAFSYQEPLVLDPTSWAVTWVEGETGEDVLGNHVVWILARVVNLIYGPHGRSPSSKAKREDFLRELEVWRSGLSETFVGIPYGDKDEEGFRKIYFPVTAAAAAAFCTLLSYTKHLRYIY